MGCCPTGNYYYPLVKDCNDNIRPLSSNESLRVDLLNGTKPWIQLEGDATYYVETWGNDLTGDGSAEKPWATMEGVINGLSNVKPGAYEITVQFGYGSFVHNSTILPANIPFSNAVVIKGHRTNTNALSPTLSNIDTAYTDNPNPGPSGTYLQYFDCDVDLTGLTGLSNVRQGDFYRIFTATGGTNPMAVVGLHEIISFNTTTDVATLRVWSRKGVSALPSGTITVTDGNIIHTRFDWDSSFDFTGVEVKGGFGCEWEDIIFVGNQNQFDTRRGLQVLAGGSIECNPRCGWHNWDVGLEVFAGGVAECPVCSISKCWTLGISGGSGASIRFNFDATINGCGTAAIQMQSEATIACGDCKMVGCGNTYMALAWNSGHIECTDSYIYYGNATLGTTYGLYATTLGNINATGVTFSGMGTDKVEATQGRIEPPPP